MSPQIIFIVGPTASGKSEKALALAKQTQAAIFNCDSIQMYQQLNIGSAKPSQFDFESVPHFLFDIVPLGEEITAGEYRRIFFETVEKVKDQFSTIIVVGGTGFYFQALEKGMYSIGAANEEIKNQVEAELGVPGGAVRLQLELMEKDPELGEKIALADHYRLGRAIEIIRAHGRSVTEIKRDFDLQSNPFPYPLIKKGIQISKEELIPRVRLRTEKMLKAGLLNEVQSLLDQGLENWSPLSSVGYRECVDFLKGRIRSEHELAEKIIMNTMRLAKKQKTWFRRDPQIEWIEFDKSLSIQKS